MVHSYPFMHLTVWRACLFILWGLGGGQQGGERLKCTCQKQQPEDNLKFTLQPGLVFAFSVSSHPEETDRYSII